MEIRKHFSGSFLFVAFLALAVLLLLVAVHFFADVRFPAMTQDIAAIGNGASVLGVSVKFRDSVMVFYLSL